MIRSGRLTLSTPPCYTAVQQSCSRGSRLVHLMPACTGTWSSVTESRACSPLLRHCGPSEKVGHFTPMRIEFVVLSTMWVRERPFLIAALSSSLVSGGKDDDPHNVEKVKERSASYIHHTSMHFVGHDTTARLVVWKYLIQNRPSTS